MENVQAQVKLVGDLLGPPKWPMVADLTRNCGTNRPVVDDPGGARLDHTIYHRGAPPRRRFERVTGSGHWKPTTGAVWSEPRDLFLGVERCYEEPHGKRQPSSWARSS